MPVWLINILISLAIKFGVPWLMAKFPLISPAVQQIIDGLLSDLQSHSQQKAQIVSGAKEQIRKVCSGTTCPTDVVI